ncbi:YicC/YloC family endoribonuclease [Helcococcus ovis]|uniref:YicC family protein n=3 Tax=Helcococcus ovis TaxID=72026 RepID=A0A4R9C2E3_9FIRM|nr:YicC/YloC family endoribonuclease [Helcococcus ovis]TFF63927.1 YicC family protein [Helcococcus ovis]TFF67137.1 YicC family protein [Helcococcus ovis]TFF67969.1 YicC family protein [Helcococcus ovis]WNZ01924.1 YicC family protein [Helcococcus ovis]
MIKSMTGFGKSHFQDENVNFNIEIKTINSRYLDINIKMPNKLNFFEDKIKNIVKSYINRGRVDVYIKSDSRNIGKSNIVVDLDSAKKMYDSLRLISNHLSLSDKNSEPNLSEILKNEDILTYESQDLDEEYLYNIVKNTMEIALSDVVKMRVFEGENLYKDLNSNIGKLNAYVDEVNNNISGIKEELREKIYKNISEILEKNIIDEDRLANEIVYYADKVDINEEITRLYSHILHFKRVLESSESIGKKLDFITQELLRETNTIASKSSKIEIINLVIEMKTIIEKIKEQVQNIE